MKNKILNTVLILSVVIVSFNAGYSIGYKTPHDKITFHSDGEVTIEPIKKGKAWISYSNKPGKGNTR